MDSRFFHAKRVFVTGITGFKGTWLTKMLCALDAKVFGVDIKNEGAFGAVNSDVAFEYCDVRNAAKLLETVRTFRPDVVFHLAAQPIVSISYREPSETFATNVTGTVNLLEAVRRVESVRSLVVVTSDKCYKNTGGASGGYTEDSPLGGDDPYSASKACQDIVTQSYIASFFEDSAVNVATARAGNAIGGGDFAADRLVPDIVRAVERGDDVVLRNPGAVRPWQHVIEPISGYLLLAEKLWTGEADHAYNFSAISGDSITVGDLASLLVARFRRGTEVRFEPGEFKETSVLTLNAEKAIRELRWEPRLSIGEVVELTAAWYEAYLNSEDVGSITHRQIEEYFTAR